MLTVEKIRTNLIKEKKGNAKVHTHEQIEQIKTSILEFGFNDPIAIDENNIIIEGHGRYMACKELDYKEIECVRITGLTETQKTAYAIAHNQLTLNTEFDLSKLELQLSEIGADIDMSDFGIEPMDWEPPAIEKKELLPYRKVHYLISADINDNAKLLDMLDKLRGECDINVNSTLN